MSASRFFDPRPQIMDEDGVIVHNGTIAFYETETLTEADFYEDEELSTPYDNPLTLGTDGRIPPIWLEGGHPYRVIVKDSEGNTIWDEDPFYGSRVSGTLDIVESIADLRTLDNANDGDTVYVGSYYGDNNGGGGIFYWKASSSATDNGGTVIKPTATAGNGRWLRPSGERINVKEFGAKGDGTDATEAFESARDALADIGSGTFYMPAGEYLLTENLFFEHGDLRIIGEGMGVTKLVYDDWDSGIIVAKGYPAPTEIIENITISDFEVDGGNYTGSPVGANDTYGNGININGCDNVVVERCYVHHTNQQGIPSTYFGVGGSLQQGTKILNCRLHDIPTGLICIGAEGIDRNVLISGNTVEGLKAGGVGIWIGGNGLDAPDDGGNNRVVNNTVIAEDPATDNNATGIWVHERNYNCVISGNVVDGPDIGVRAGYFDDSAEENFEQIIANNQILNWYEGGIQNNPLAAGTTGRLVISGNVIRSETITSGQRFGIWLGGQTICTGNRVVGGRANIYMNMTTQNIVSGNFCEGGTDASILIADVGQSVDDNVVTGNITDVEIYDDDFGELTNTNIARDNFVPGGTQRASPLFFAAARVTYGTAIPVTANYPYLVGSIHFNISGASGQPIAWTLTAKAGGGDTWTPWANL